MSAQWKHSLITGILDDPMVCLKTYFCPCLTIMDIAEYVEPGSGVTKCVTWLLALNCCLINICLVDQPLRAKVAEKAGISVADSNNSCPVVCCCNCCHAIQLANEVNELKKGSGAPEQQVMGAPEMHEMA